MNSNFWGGIIFVVCCITFFVVYGGINEIYVALANIDLLSEDGSPPFSSKITQWFLSLFTTLWIGQTIYERKFPIEYGQDKNTRLDFGITATGLFIFLIFNILKAMAFKPYSYNTLAQLLSFVLDAFTAYGIWWSLTQYRKNLLERLDSARVGSNN